MIRWLLIAAFLCAPLHAALEDFPLAAQRSLFAADDPYSAKPSKAPEPVDASPAGEFDTGMFGLAFWGTPFLRFTGDPGGIAGGVGLELSVHFGQSFALVAGVGAWSSYVEAARSTEIDAGGFELDLGFRWRFWCWDGGSMYTDARAAFANFDGNGPVRSTSSIGGGGHFGIELGSNVFRVYFEGGMEWRAALNYRNVGWLYTGEANGDGGIYFDLLRVGLRVYL